MPSLSCRVSDKLTPKQTPQTPLQPSNSASASALGLLKFNGSSFTTLSKLDPVFTLMKRRLENYTEQRSVCVA